MLKFIFIHGERFDLDQVREFTDDQLEDAYFDLKSEQVSVQCKLTDLRIDAKMPTFDKVREAGLLSASRHISFGIEFVQSIRKSRKVRVADKFMNRAREVLDADVFEGILEAVR